MHLKSNCPEIKWIIAHSATNDFARSCDQYLLKFGTLTENMLTAVQRGLQSIAQAADVSGAGVERIATAFATAQGNGIKRPKLYLGSFLFKLAPAGGRNAGAIYVMDGETYLGKIADGKFFASRDCSDEQRAAITKVCRDPAGEAVAYGMRTGICACCARELTNAESIDRGIGPICAEKYGF